MNLRFQIAVKAVQRRSAPCGDLFDPPSTALATRPEPDASHTAATDASAAVPVDSFIPPGTDQ